MCIRDSDTALRKAQLVHLHLHRGHVQQNTQSRRSEPMQNFTGNLDLALHGTNPTTLHSVQVTSMVTASVQDPESFTPVAEVGGCRQWLRERECRWWLSPVVFVDAAGVTHVIAAGGCHLWLVVPPLAGVAADGWCDGAVVAAYGWCEGANVARLKRTT